MPIVLLPLTCNANQWPADMLWELVDRMVDAELVTIKACGLDHGDRHTLENA